MRKAICYLCLSLLLLSACKNQETHDDHAGHDREFTLHTALQIPERVIGLVGVDNFQDIDFELNDEMRFQLSGVIKDFERDYRQMTEDFARQLLLTKTESEEVKSRVIADYKSADPAIAIPVLKYTFPSYARIKENLPKLHLPLQLISCGRGDTNEEALKKACRKGVNIRYIDNAGHFPMIEKPTEFNMVLAEILTRL